MPRALLAVGCADLALTAFARGRARRLRCVTKPLLMPALARWVHAQTGTTTERGRTVRSEPLVRRTLLALGLSTAGDVALLREDDTALLEGVAAFLAAHVSYIGAFASRRGDHGVRGLAVRTAPVGVVWAAVVPALAARAGSLGLPVASYGTALAAMQAAALTLDDGVPAAARARIGVGASVFLVSDALLGLDRFVLARRHRRALDVAVMATYLAAQTCIADGVVRAATAQRA